MIKLKISSLEFEDIKANIKEYFKKDERYLDYNFEGSNISTLLNILAYNSHYTGFYIKLVLNEAFADTAQTKEALISHAKKQGYIVKGKTASYASVSVEVLDADPELKFITLKSGTTFNSTSTSENKTVFHTLTDYTIKNNNGKFKIDNVIIHQGQIIRNIFRVETTRQRFRLADAGCDVNTIKVFIKNSETSTVREMYNRVDDIIDIETNSKVWYVAMASTGVYDIYFGEDKFGKQPELGQFVEIEFMSCLGSASNNINKFTIAPEQTSNVNAIGHYKEFVVKTIEISHGGTDEETPEELRYAIPNHSKRQKRVVNENDYKSVLLNEYRDVESINVWGGEKNTTRAYAKMFVAIKPHNSDNISETAKTIIRNNLVRRYGIVGSNIVFVKPEYINLDLTINVKKSRLSNIEKDQVESELTIKAEKYNKEILTKFDSVYSDTNFITYLREDIDYISTMFTRKVINKKVEFDKGKNTRYQIIIGNTISNLTSLDFNYGINTVYLKNEDNLIYVYNAEDDTKLTPFSIGEVNLNTGDVFIDVPKDIVEDYITIQCTPLNPDIETSLNNIVRFSSIKVEVS